MKITNHLFCHALALLILAISNINCQKSYNKTYSYQSVINHLHALWAAQVSFKGDNILDKNKNGVGEYGFLQELINGHPNGYSYIYFANYTVNNEIVTTYEGYNYYIYLPGNNKAISKIEDRNLVEIKNISKQEQFWICYAWPHRGNGLLVFAINQEGEIFVYNNSNKKYWSYTAIPYADAALNKNGKYPKNLEAPLGSPTADGEMWISLSK